MFRISVLVILFEQGGILLFSGKRKWSIYSYGIKIDIERYTSKTYGTMLKHGPVRLHSLAENFILCQNWLMKSQVI
jgi:hypothetical protein